MNTGNIILEKSGKRLVISISQERSKIKKHVVIFLLMLIITGFSIPIITLIFAISEIKITFIITLMVFWGSAIYFLRLLLWNLYGMEKLILDDNKLIFYNDYRFFKDNFIEESFTNIEIGISEYRSSGLGISEFKPIQMLENYANTDISGYFQLKYDNQIIHSSIKTPVNHMFDAADDINIYLLNNTKTR